MNTRTTLALLIAAIGLGIAAYVLQQGPPPQPDAQADSTDFLLPAMAQLADGDDVRLRISPAQGDPFTIERRSGTWQLTEPVTYELSQGPPGQLFERVKNLTRLDSITPGRGEDADITPDELGLNPPRFVLTLRTLGDEPREALVRVGRRTLGGRGYAAIGQGEPAAGTVESTTVYVVPDPLHSTLADLDINDWRSRNLTDWQADNLTGIRLFRDDGSGIDLRKVDGQWQVDLGQGLPADPDKVRGLVDDLRFAWVHQFVQDRADDESLRRYGLDQPRLTVELLRPEDGSGTLRVGLPADLDGDYIFATWSTGQEPSRTVLQLRQSVIADLPRAPEDLLPDPEPQTPPATETEPADAANAGSAQTTDPLTDADPDSEGGPALPQADMLSK